MIVPSMTLEEIRKEIEKDYPILYRKLGYMSEDMRKKLSKQQLLNGYETFFDYRSKYKNQWVNRICVFKPHVNIQCMLVYHNGKGHVGIVVTAKRNLIYHTGHFFSRFNERKNLGLVTFHDIICHYLTESNAIDIQEMEEVAPGVFTMFAVVPSGIIMGTVHRPFSLIKANTFLSHEMLNHRQTELKNLVKETMKKYQETAGLLT